MTQIALPKNANLFDVNGFAANGFVNSFHFERQAIVLGFQESDAINISSQSIVQSL